MTTVTPRVSVILPVYNGEAYLLEAIESILGQTYADFELIVLDDGSRDGTAALLDAVRDPRVRVVHQENIGLALTLNKGIALARGEYIARQDADDISRPERLARQVAYLDAHPACGLLGTWSVIQEDRVLTTRQHRHPCSNGELQFRLLFDSFFVHSSVMMRRSALERAGLYPTDPERNPPEDFDLWLRIARDHAVANIPEPLLVYREVPGSISRTRAELLDRRAIAIAAENLGLLVGPGPSESSLRDLVALMRHSPQALSPETDQGVLVEVLRQARDRLAAAWPEDAEGVERGFAEAVAVLGRAPIRNSTAGRIDVVIPAYNAAAFIEDALGSVAAQGECVARVIVVDDGSSDDTVRVVEEFGRRHPQLPVTCLRQANAGPSAARNRGLAQVKAEFVALLDADDLWAPDKLRRQLAVFDRPRFERLGVVYCGYGLMSPDGERLENRGFRLDPTVRGDVERRLLEANLIAGSASAVLVRRACLERVGTFDERLVCAEDWDLWLRIAEHYTFDCVEEELVWLRQHAGNAQKNELRMLGGELLFLDKLYARGKSSPDHFDHFWRRLEGRGLRAWQLKGFASCHLRVQLLMTGVPAKLSKLRADASARARRVPHECLKGFYRVYPHVPAFIRRPLKRIWSAVRPKGSR